MNTENPTGPVPLLARQGVSHICTRFYRPQGAPVGALSCKACGRHVFENGPPAGWGSMTNEQRLAAVSKVMGARLAGLLKEGPRRSY